MKTLKQLRQDPRISCVNKCEDLDWGNKYEVWLNDGWRYDDDSHYFTARTIKEINEEMDCFVRQEYYYGMRMRGFSHGCQPMKDLVDHWDAAGEYKSVLVYSRALTDDEIAAYELTPIEKGKLQCLI